MENAHWCAPRHILRQAMGDQDTAAGGRDGLAGRPPHLGRGRYNLAMRQDVLASETESFTYDFLDRLTGAPLNLFDRHPDT